MAKGKKAEAAKAEPGHNIQADERVNQGLFISGFARYKKSLEVGANWNSSHRNLLKELKADGIPKKDLEYALKLEKTKDDEEAIRQQLREQQLARWLGHKLGTQADLFAGDTADRTPITDKAYEEGFRAGSAGAGNTPPYDGDAGQQWIKGWHAGQAVIHQKFLENNKPGESTLVRTVPPEPEGTEYDDAMDDASEAKPEEEGQTATEQLRELTARGEAEQQRVAEKIKEEKSKLN